MKIQRHELSRDVLDFGCVIRNIVECDDSGRIVLYGEYTYENPKP